MTRLWVILAAIGATLAAAIAVFAKGAEHGASKVKLKAEKAKSAAKERQARAREQAEQRKRKRIERAKNTDADIDSFRDRRL